MLYHCFFFWSNDLENGLPVSWLNITSFNRSEDGNSINLECLTCVLCPCTGLRVLISVLYLSNRLHTVPKLEQFRDSTMSCYQS